MPIIVNCKKCSSFQAKGYKTSIDINHFELCIRCYNREYYKQNKQKFLDAANSRYSNNREECLEGMKNYYGKNKERIKKYYNEYYQKNKDRMQKQMKEYYDTVLRFNQKEIYQKKKKKVKGDLYFKLKENLRSRAGMAIKNHKGTKFTSSLKLLGADINTVRQYIEKQFKGGMSWKNHGEWHIDHIVPCVKFDLNNKEEQKKCFHYTNLQPLWAKENLTKGGN